MEKNNKTAVVATDDEPQLNYRGWKSMPFVIGNETFEKLGTTGTSSNLLVYLTTVFNMKSITATTLINIFNGTTNFATLLGAFLSDTYFGRYKTLGFASVASFLGMLVLTLTAAISKLHPPDCGNQDSGACPGPTPWQMAFLFIGLGLMVIGAGGIRPCNLAFGADQFNPNTESGKKGITSFFNWYYCTFTFAMMISLTVIVYVQSDVSWAWGLGIPAFMMFLSCAMFFLGSRLYVKVKPDGSPLASTVQVFVAAIKKRHLKLPEEPWLTLHNHIPKNCINSKLPRTGQFRCLDKAAIMTPEDQIKSDGSAINPWRLSSMQKVEEVKVLIRVIPIWASAIVYYVALVQQQTYAVFQALQSDRRVGNTHFKIPAASYAIFSMLGLTIWIPIYDRIIVPRLQRLTKKEGGITILQRMAIGMILAIFTMIISGIIEDKRRSLALSRPVGLEQRRGAISSLSGLWLIPQLSLIGFSEAFTIIAEVEFYYKQFPENMRSIGGSLAFVGFAISNYLNGFLISMVHRFTKGASTGDWLPEDLNKGRLDYFYYLVAALGLLNFGFFLLCAKWYKYKGSGDGAPEVAMEKLNPEKSPAPCRTKLGSTGSQRLPVDFGVVSSGVVCNGIFYVYSETDKLAGYDIERGFWIGIQTSPFPPRVIEYYPKLVSCSGRLFMLSVSWCEGDGQIGCRNKAVRKLWELDLTYLAWTEVPVHPDAPMDWNAAFVADRNHIFGVEMFKIFGQVLDFLTVCDVSEKRMNWSHISRNHMPYELDATSCMTKSLAVLHL